MSESRAESVDGRKGLELGWIEELRVTERDWSEERAQLSAHDLLTPKFKTSKLSRP